MQTIIPWQDPSRYPLERYPPLRTIHGPKAAVKSLSLMMDLIILANV